MKVLITGGTGFVAPYLYKELSANGHTVSVVAHRAVTPSAFRAFPVSVCDLNKGNAAKDLILDLKPDAVVHLAGYSHVGNSGRDPSELVESNVVLTHDLCRTLLENNSDTVFLFASSAMVYVPDSTRDAVFNEGTTPNPTSPYGMSKLAAEYVVKSCASKSFRPYIVRPFNHIGPFQSQDFVCSALAHRIALAKDGGEVRIGNLEAERDFSDVRDIVRAYRLILEKQPSQPVFVLGSGQLTPINEIFEMFIKISKKNVRVFVDPKLQRAKDPNSFYADSSLARSVLGWKCEIPLHQTLKEMYESALSENSFSKTF